MAVAAMWGTSVGYSDYGDTVVIETIDGRVIVVRKHTFDFLYYRLDNFTASLKENCIEYIVNEDSKCLFDYPTWYVEAVEDGFIYVNDGVDMFYTESGEIAMSPNSIILRNYKGELMYMEANVFSKYYDTIGE